MSKNPAKTDVLISGGGIPGLTLALLLGRLGADVTVVDPAPPDVAPDTGRDTRTSALMLGSINVLKQTGAWEACERQAGIMRSLRIVDDSRDGGRPVSVDFRASEIGQDLFGMNIPNGVLRTALLDEARRVRNIRLLMPARLEGFEADDFGVTVRIAGGQDVRARLVVGADGRASPTRKAAGIDARRRDYGQKAITCFIAHTQDHRETSTEFHRPGGPFTLVPLPGKASSVVWVEYDEDADRFFTMDKRSFEQALQARTNDCLGTVSLDRPPQLWPLSMLAARQLTARRVALVAEAAHVIHPLGAQGLNLSLRDTAALAEILADALRAGIDPGSRAVLDQYERRRRHDIEGRVWGTHLFNRIVSTDAPALHGLRKAGLKTLDYLSPLKHLAMQQGMAPAQDESRLARGEPI